MSVNNILDVKQLTKTYTSGFVFKSQDTFKAVNEVSFALPEKPTVISLVGESGSGKSTIAKLILNLRIPTSGEIIYNGVDIAKMNKEQYKTYRREVQGIFQDPFSAVNPLRKVGYIFKILSKKIASLGDSQQIINDVLKDVGLNESFLDKYPYQHSGGELQRLLMARAFVLRPKIIIADEPVSMLDASLRATVLKIMRDMKEKYHTSFIYITHDLSTAHYIGDRMIVLYKGCIVEHGDSNSVIMNPQHPYTRALIESIPIPDPSKKWSDRIQLPKEDEDMVGGCLFYNRCSEICDGCKQGKPPFVEVEPEHYVACFIYQRK